MARLGGEHGERIRWEHLLQPVVAGPSRSPIQGLFKDHQKAVPRPDHGPRHGPPKGHAPSRPLARVLAPAMVHREVPDHR